jgi:hypothetical protein
MPDAPATTEAPPANAALTAVFDSVLGDGPDDGGDDLGLGEPREPKIVKTEPAADPEPAAAPAKTKEKAEEKPPTKTAEDSLLDRLAPDFTEKAEEKTEDIKPDEGLFTEDQIKGEKSTKKQGDMRKFDTMYRERGRKIAELEAKLQQQGQPNAEAETRIAALTKELQDRDARLERVDLQSSPKFQAELIQPRLKMFNDATDIVKEYGVDVSKLQSALRMKPGKERAAIMDEIREEISSPTMQQKLDRLVDGIDEKTIQINERLQNARQSTEEERRQQTIEREKEFQRAEVEVKGMLSAARRELLEKHGVECFQRVDKPGYEWWNSQIEDAERAAETIMLKATPQSSAMAANLAASFGMMRNMFRSERKARLASEARLKELEGAKGDLKDGGNKTRTPASNGESDNWADDVIAGLRQSR